MIIKSDNNTRAQHLDTSTLIEGEDVYCLAYVQNVQASTTMTGDRFYFLALKDCQGKSIKGAFFDVQKENELLVMAMARKPVKIMGKVMVYKGRYQLKLDTVERYTGDFPYEQFTGSVSELPSRLVESNQNLKALTQNDELEFSRKLLTIRAESVYGGKTGGYLKLIEMCIFNLISLEGITELDIKRLGEIFHKVVEPYGEYLTSKDVIGFLPKSNRFKILQECSENYEGDTDVIDLLSALMGIEEPEGANARVLYQIITTNLDILNFTTYSTQAVNGEVSYYKSSNNRSWKLVKIEMD